jgi:hypothetical protein
VSKEPTGPQKFRFRSLLPKIDETKKFYKKSVIFYGFWRFLEVHSILAKY